MDYSKEVKRKYVPQNKKEEYNFYKDLKYLK